MKTWPSHTGMSYQLCMQGRINHCAGCTMGGFPPPSGGRSTAKFLPRCFDVWTFSVGLNVTTTTKQSTFWRKSASPDKILAIRVWEKVPASRWYGALNG